MSFRGEEIDELISFLVVSYYARFNDHNATKTALYDLFEQTINRLEARCREHEAKAARDAEDVDTDRDP